MAVEAAVRATHPSPPPIPGERAGDSGRVRNLLNLISKGWKHQKCLQILLISAEMKNKHFICWKKTFEEPLSCSA